MSLLEVITKASSAVQTLPDKESDCPIVLNPDPIFANLKPESGELVAGAHVRKATGWKISPIDKELIVLGQNIIKTLKRKLKDTNSFGKAEFLDLLTSYLETFRVKVGISLTLNKAEASYACAVVEKFGVLMDRDVKGLVLEACVSLEVWDVLDVLIVNGLVPNAFSAYLVNNLIEKRNSDLIVSCVKHLPDLQAYDLMCILKYFLILPGDGYKSLVGVREHWEGQANLAIEKARGKDSKSLTKSPGKIASILLVMLAYDGFSVSELCLHHFLVSPNLDEVVFSACVSKLNGDEIKALIQYLGKWLRKYERFPQAVPYPKVISSLGLKVCEWVPTLETVVKYLGLVVDEHFSSLVLGSEFDELRSLEGVVSSLAGEAKLCGALANLIESVKNEDQVMGGPLGNFTL